MMKPLKRRLKFRYYKVLCRVLGDEGSRFSLKRKFAHVLPGKKNAAVLLTIKVKVTKVDFRNWLHKEASINNVDCWAKDKGEDTLEVLFVGRRKRVNPVVKTVYKGFKQAQNEQVQETWYNQSPFEKKDVVSIANDKHVVPDDFSWSLESKKVSSLVEEVLLTSPNEYDASDKFSSHRLFKREFAKVGYQAIKEGKFLFLTNGTNNLVFCSTETINTSVVAYRIAKDKKLARKRFIDSGLSVAKGEHFSNSQKEEAWRFAQTLEACVLKPLRGRKGRAVFVGINSKHQFEYAWETAKSTTKSGILIEEQFQGCVEGRFLVVGNSCIAAYIKVPPFIVGNGHNTVQELVNQKNMSRKSNPHAKRNLINLDQHRVEVLHQQGYRLSDVPNLNEILLVDEKSSISAGGDSFQKTDTVHSSYKRIAELAAMSIPGLDVAGIDILAKDFSKKATKDNHIIIEANTRPGLGGHHFPIYGDPQNVAKEITDQVVCSLGTNKESQRNHRFVPIYKQDNTIDEKVNINCQLISQEFTRLGYKVDWLEKDFIIIDVDGSNVAFSITNSSNTSIVARRILKDKDLTKKLFSRAQVSVPEGQLFETKDYQQALTYFKTLNFPVVVKPVDGSKGRAVSVGIKNDIAFEKAWSCAKKQTSKGIIVEKQFLGAIEARLLVVGGKCIAVYRKDPPKVTGNGVDSIDVLIAKKNNERKKNPHLVNKLILLDEHRLDVIKSQGFSISSVPPQGQDVLIDVKASISSGGDTVTITDSIHPTYKDIAERAALAVPGLDLVGVDCLAKDFSREATQGEYVVIEANDRAGIGGHHFPVKGEPNDVAREIVDYALRKVNLRSKRL